MKRSTVLPSLVLVLLAVLFMSSTIAVCDSNRGTVCGLNTRTGTPLRDWDLMGGIKSKVKSSLRDQNSLIPMMQATSWPPNRPSSETQQPSVWLMRGNENAYATDFLGWVPGHPAPTIFMDDDWLSSLQERTGNSWIRTTVLAHELGHIRYSHPYGGGAPTTWQREYDADVFAGLAVCKLGGSLSQGREIYPYLAREGPEDPNSHPSLSARLRAFKQGWQSGGCVDSSSTGYFPSVPQPEMFSATVIYASRYPHGIAFEVGGTRYEARPAEEVKVNLADRTSAVSIWECPNGNCRWSSFAIRAGGVYRIVDWGAGGLRLEE